ncbi:MAG: hypothetical protein ABI193_17030, partial [Minicystis sp.]
VLRQLPEVIDQASADELKVHLGQFLERTFTDWAKKETTEIGTALETLAEKTIALVREDAHDVAKRVSAALGGDVKAPDVEVDTFGYDMGVIALATIGVSVMFANALLLGGALVIAAPALAMYVRSKVEIESKKRAKELAPTAIRDAAGKLGPKLEEMINDFAARLDAWVVSAGEELHREVIEVLTATRNERAETAHTTEQSVAVCDAQATELDTVLGRLEGQRSALWTPTNGETLVSPPAAPLPNAPGGSA